jgi:hypothetical protein
MLGEFERPQDASTQARREIAVQPKIVRDREVEKVLIRFCVAVWGPQAFEMDSR